MALHSSISPGILLQDLLRHWKQQFTGRATGGWWALAGFAFQMSVFLLRFFQSLEEGTTEPGLLAEMEELSDVLCPHDGRLRLIQVKRTLTKATLVSAVKEAYLITDLCRRKTPALLGLLRFQIACRKIQTDITVTDLSMSDVIKTDGDATSWKAMRDQFDAENPIIEEPDPLDQLHIFLWNGGVKNTTALIEQCLGRLLRSFDVKGPDVIRAVGRDLNSFFLTAERRANWTAVGQVLTAEDIASDPLALEYKEVLTGQTPKLEHLRKGCFRDRPKIFESLWQVFTDWLSMLDAADRMVNDKTPVFWISGRSGEGKSVVLLQLIAKTLQSDVAGPLLHLKSGDELIRLFATAPDEVQLSDQVYSRIFAVVDDVYDLPDRETWDENIRNQCSLGTPPVALITCGPTEQREQFASHLSDIIEVSGFELPNLDLEECREFIAWYKSRTGQARQLSAVTTQNPLLVQLIFELAQGMRLGEFARRFKQRLAHLELFEAARTILAVNALYMDAPIELITTNKRRDALEYLCAQDQLHFQVIPGDTVSEITGVRLAHPHLAWLLFVEWVEPPTTLAKAWARQLAKALIIFESDPVTQSPGEVIHELLGTNRLADADEVSSLPPTADRRELIRELYRLHVSEQDQHPTLRTLPRWLELEYKIPELQLVPDPAACAVGALSDSARASCIHGSVATWVWLISEFKPRQECERMCNTAKEFFTRFPDNPGVAFALAHLLTKMPNDQNVKKFVCDWLGANETHPQAYQLLAALVAANPSDSEVIRLATDWLTANETHPKAHHVLSSLVKANPADSEVMRLATDWLTANETQPQAYQLLPALVAANPTDSEVMRLATDWLTANETQPQAYQLLPALVAANPTDSEVMRLATDWLTANETHPQAYHVLGALVAANPTDSEVMRLATDWLTANESHPEAYCLLKVMISRSDGAKGWLERGEQYLKMPDAKHPEEVLAVLLTGGKAAPKFIEMALDFTTGSVAKKHRRSVLFALSRSVVYNFQNAVQYLNAPYDERRKNMVCTAIAFGMKRFPDTISGIVLDALKQLSPSHVYHILRSSIARRLEVDYVDQMIRQWLIDNFRRPGYGSMLDALRKNPSHWMRLQALGTIPSRIMHDFAARDVAEPEDKNNQ
jgi:predicted Zn-dependent protease